MCSSGWHFWLWLMANSTGQSEAALFAPWHDIYVSLVVWSQTCMFHQSFQICSPHHSALFSLCMDSSKPHQQITAIAPTSCVQMPPWISTKWYFCYRVSCPAVSTVLRDISSSGSSDNENNQDILNTARNHLMVGDTEHSWTDNEFSDFECVVHWGSLRICCPPCSVALVPS